MATRPTTTIRVDNATRAELAELARERGTSIQAAARDAADALWREQLAQSVRTRIDELATDPEAWSTYLAEGRATEVPDGTDR